MNSTVTLAYAFGGVMLYLLIWYFYKPLKWLMRIVVRSAFGCVGLMLFNLLSGITGMTIGVNLVTAFITGTLGIPGLGLLLILQKMV